MLNAKEPHFFVPFSPNLSSERLKIPLGFIKHMEGRTSGVFSLTGPSENTWKVDMVQCDNDLFLQNGWAEFVKDHCLDGCDSLVFRYDGSLHFTVQIFDQSSCEKEAAFNAKCSQNPDDSNNPANMKRGRVESETVISDKIFEGVPKKMRGSSFQREELTSEETCRKEAMTNGKRKKTSMDSQSKASHEKTDCMSIWSTSEEGKAAQSFNSRFPNFVRTMKKFNISGSYTLKIPYRFSMAYLPKYKTKIVLCNARGECWAVNSIPTTKVQTCHTICGGWMAFVRANDIKIGDICIFELVCKCKLCVHIFRDGKGGLVESVPSNNDVSFNEDDASPNKTVKCSKSLQNFDLDQPTQSEACDEKTEPVKQKIIRSKHKVQPHARVFKSLFSIPEEERAAKSFTSQFPFFVRTMKKFNVISSYTLKIPCEFSMAHLPKYKTKIVLHNLKGDSWTVNSVPEVRAKTIHTLCGGWMAFVHNNGIKLGDTCIFELVGTSELLVHIIGAARKGLDDSMTHQLQT